MFEVICYRAKFELFSKASSSWVAGLPADHDDDFALICAINQDGTLGFDRTPSAKEFVSALIAGCYCVDISGALLAPGDFRGQYMPSIFFKDRNGCFDRMAMEHERYLLELKKHAFLSRYKSLQSPCSSPLSDFLLGGGRSVSKSLYVALMESCEFFCMSKLSGEYGWGAFDVTSSNMAGFLLDLENNIPAEGHITLKANIQEVPCW
ncbi:hypothetical protein [Pseudomonas sp. LAM2023]|uniref:hypothetical protein n=1 Tax=Pseudomonas sp. LAM2023 TaxID=2800477 RepID=UPI00190C8F23|nr:hypothetical protein [Pseudomonas sp. LAM2023]